jgi:methionyl-tRNA synthetase
MVGKEIVRFHCVYWPAFLLAAELPLPRSIIAHGWLLFEDSKMSKSRGNVVRAETVVDVLGNDALRYFLLREIVFGQDGSFSFDALVQRYNSDLANDLGNLSSRTLTMIARYFDEVVPAAGKPGRAEKAVAKTAGKVIKEFRAHFNSFEFSRALESAWSLVGAVNKYIVEAEPWALAEKSDKPSRARLRVVLYTAAEALRVVTALAHPAMPESTARIWKQMGLGNIARVRLDRLAWGKSKASSRAPTSPQSKGCRKWKKNALRTRPQARRKASRRPPPPLHPLHPLSRRRRLPTERFPSTISPRSRCAWARLRWRRKSRTPTSCCAWRWTSAPKCARWWRASPRSTRRSRSSAARWCWL